jgi:ATP-binding cassette subfamily A (ABC1) protein 3
MIIYLIPFYYLVSKIAQEKESKSREGMKMMGLQDSTYFLSWFIIFFIISLGISIITTLFAVFGVFKKVDIILFFIFNILYSMTLYGWAFTIVAFLPTKRSSSIAATLFHIISFYLSFLLKDPNTDSGLQYGMSIFPNVCMNQIVKQIFFYNYNTDKGLSWGTLGVAY